MGEITFWYNMFGAAPSLSVVRLSDNVEVWRRDGQQSADGSDWLFGTASVHGAPFAFRGIRGGGYRGDIAIDDVSIGCATTPPPMPPAVPPPPFAPPPVRCEALFNLVLVIDRSGSMQNYMSEPKHSPSRCSIRSTSILHMRPSSRSATTHGSMSR